MKGFLKNKKMVALYAGVAMLIGFLLIFNIGYMTGDIEAITSQAEGANNVAQKQIDEKTNKYNELVQKYSANNGEQNGYNPVYYSEIPKIIKGYKEKNVVSFGKWDPITAEQPLIDVSLDGGSGDDKTADPGDSDSSGVVNPSFVNSDITIIAQAVDQYATQNMDQVPTLSVVSEANSAPLLSHLNSIDPTGKYTKDEIYTIDRNKIEKQINGYTIKYPFSDYVVVNSPNKSKHLVVFRLQPYTNSDGRLTH